MSSLYNLQLLERCIYSYGEPLWQCPNFKLPKKIKKKIMKTVKKSTGPVLRSASLIYNFKIKLEHHYRTSHRFLLHITRI